MALGAKGQWWLQAAIFVSCLSKPNVWQESELWQKATFSHIFNKITTNETKNVTQ